MADPFDHPHDTEYVDGQQLSVYRLPADYLFAEADDGVLIPLDACASDGLSDDELDRRAEQAVTAYEESKANG